MYCANGKTAHATHQKILVAIFSVSRNRVKNAGIFFAAALDR